MKGHPLQRIPWLLHAFAAMTARAAPARAENERFPDRWMLWLGGLQYRVMSRFEFAVDTAINRFSMGLESREDHSTLSLNTGWTGLGLYGNAHF